MRAWGAGFEQGEVVTALAALGAPLLALVGEARLVLVTNVIHHVLSGLRVQYLSHRRCLPGVVGICDDASIHKGRCDRRLI